MFDQKFFVYVDGHPSENLEDGGEERWHTHAFIWIPTQSKYIEFIKKLKLKLPKGEFRKWAGRKSGYRNQFIDAFTELVSSEAIYINIISFQEKSIRAAKEFLIKATEINFEQIDDTRGRIRGIHQSVNFKGCKPYILLENEELPVMTLAWLAMEQHDFYYNHWTDTRQTPCTFELFFDHIDGDQTENQPKLDTLRYIIYRIYEEKEFIINVADESHNAMYLTDNLAGWCGQAIENPNSELAQRLCKIPNIESFVNWSELVPSAEKLIQRNVWPRIKTEYRTA